ncbi:Unknown protein sequence [Pseudomonas cannabina]|uniref:Uncharacterized protein n=1 Tax=Pseudomonas cannabina TaxID=86840 RepID=A0A0P9MJ74_PSECA|nr:Unknown protein sequence [Pseudomonas cannabina]
MEFDPYLTDLFPAKEHLRHPYLFIAGKSIADLDKQHGWIVGTNTEYAQAQSG